MKNPIPTQYIRPLLAVFSGLCSLLLLIIAIYAIVDPKLHLSRVTLPAALALIGGLVFGGRRIWKRPSKSLFVLLSIAIATVSIVVVARSFGEFNFMSVLHHVQFGMDGFELGAFDNEIQDALIICSSLVLAAYWFSNLIPWRRSVLLGAAAIVVLFNPMSASIFTYATRPTVDSDLVARITTPVLAAPKTAPDVIIVYLEGLDRSFADTQVYGDIYDGLMPYEDEGLTFTGVRQTEGTGWSIAGLVATQCGLPLLPNGLRKRSGYEGIDTFIPSHRCLSDDLSDFGYQSAYIVGARAGFAGQDVFLRTHNYDRLIENKTLRQRYDEGTLARAKSKWILDDRLVFDAALKEYDDMAAQEAPILLSILTYGPHGSTGVLSSNCTSVMQAIRSPDLRQTVACTIKNTALFVEEFRKQRRNRPTLVVLASDHLNHDHTGERAYLPDTTANTLIVLGMGIDDFPTGKRIDRVASMMDIYPTLLHLIGLAGPNAKAGIGVSMFSSDLTLLEEKGMERLNLELTTNYSMRSAIWR